MAYRISETTDSKFIGLCLDITQFFIGNSIEIYDFMFEIDYIKKYGNIVVASNANYVIILKKEGDE